MKKSPRNDSIKKEPLPFFHQCAKSMRHFNLEADADRAITFLYLRDNNCKRQTAVKFSQRSPCKFDTTLQRDGPNSCRILKPANGKDQSNQNGWAKVGYTKKFDMGSDFAQDNGIVVKKDLLQFDYEEKMERQLQRLDEERQKKLETDLNLNKDYDFSLKARSKKQLIEKLIHLRLSNAKAKDGLVKYREFGDQVFVDSVKQHETEKEYQLLNKDCILTQLESFKSSHHFDEDKYKIKQKPSFQLYQQIQQKQALAGVNNNEKQEIAKNYDAHMNRRATIIQSQLNSQVEESKNYLLKQRQKTVEGRFDKILTQQSNESQLFLEVNYILQKNQKIHTECQRQSLHIDNLKQNYDNMLEKHNQRVAKLSMHQFALNSTQTSNKGMSQIINLLLARRNSQNKIINQNMVFPLQEVSMRQL